MKDINDISQRWIGLALPAFMDEKILKEPGAPSGYKAVAPLIFEYPQGKTIMPGRNEPEKMDPFSEAIRG